MPSEPGDSALMAAVRLQSAMAGNIELCCSNLAELVNAAAAHKAHRDDRKKRASERAENDLCAELSAAMQVALVPLRQAFLDAVRPFALSAPAATQTDRSLGALVKVVEAHLDAEKQLIQDAEAKLPARLHHSLPKSLMAIAASQDAVGNESDESNGDDDGADDEPWHPVVVCLRIAISNVVLREMKSKRRNSLKLPLLLDPDAPLRSFSWFKTLTESAQTEKGSSPLSFRAFAARHILQNTLIPQSIEELAEMAPSNDSPDATANERADSLARNVSSILKLVAVAAADEKPDSMGLANTVEFLRRQQKYLATCDGKGETGSSRPRALHARRIVSISRATKVSELVAMLVVVGFVAKMRPGDKLELEALRDLLVPDDSSSSTQHHV